MHRAQSFLCLLAIAACLPASAQTVTEAPLYAGLSYPSALVQAADGNFYGTTESTVFKMTPNGGVTTIYVFCSLANCADGTAPSPYAGLVQGVDGNFYGTTELGGSSPGSSYFGNCCGTVFKVTPTGTLTTLYSFCTQLEPVDGNSTNGYYCADGMNPEGGLVLGSDGNFYGTTYSGGTVTSSSGNSGGAGTLFKITPAGALTTLLTLGGTLSSLEYPEGSLLQGSDGNFYGTATGTAGDVSGPQGGVFVDSPGGGFASYDFPVSTDQGTGPFGALVEGNNGNFYGTTSVGGSNSCATGGCGSTFEISPAGALETLDIFNGGTSAGAYPYGTLLLASDGNFYGTASEDGANSGGEVFRMDPAGNLSAIYSFCAATNCTDGDQPATGLVQGSDGNFYGTTTTGANGGVAYKLTNSPALPPPVQLTLSSIVIPIGQSVSLNWQVVNAFSTTMQQCAAFVQNNATGAGTWTGLQTGAFDSATQLYYGTANIVPSAAGTYTYALTCGGIESGFATLTVDRYPSSSALTATPDPASIGQSVTLTARVTGSGPTPTGIVDFYFGSLLLGHGTLISGVATDTTTTTGVPLGSYTLTATYTGDANYASSTSPGYTVSLTKANTSTSLVASPPTVAPPNDVMLTATVTRTASGDTGTPTGTVTFYFETLALGSCNLNSSGYCSFSESTANVPAATYGITAKYSGDANDNASTSTAVPVTVE